MKTALILLIAIVPSHTLLSADIFAVQNGYWTSNSTWNLNRIPSNGDIVTIPSGRTVMLASAPYSKNNPETRPTLGIKIFGTLDFSDPGNDKLYLHQGSTIQIYVDGKIMTTNNNPEIIAIYNGSYDNTVWTGSPNILYGPVIASSTTLGFANSVLDMKGFSMNSFRINKNTIRLSWTIPAESGQMIFIIEKFEEKQNIWLSVAEIKSSTPSSQPTTYYYQIELTNDKKSTYRLKLTDSLGKYVYSPAQTYSHEIDAKSRIFLDPAYKRLNVYNDTSSEAITELLLYDFNGTLKLKTAISENNMQVPVSSLAQGHYIIHLKQNSELALVKRIMIR